MTQAICHFPNLYKATCAPLKCKQVAFKFPEKLKELADRVWFIFKMNIHHLIPVAIAGVACFIPALVPGGIPFGIAMISAIGSLSTALSYYSYKLMESWHLYPYDFIKIIVPKKGVVDRPEILDRIAYYLSKPEENNVLLVGEPGTGKTTMAQAMANRLAVDPPKGLEKYKIYYLNLDGLYSVDQPFGHFEKRFLEVIKILERKKNVILFIDEAHRLFHYANGSPLSDRLKPYHGLRIFGATTTSEYKKHFKSDSMDQRFEKVKLNEMDQEMSLKVLKKKFNETDEKVLKYVLKQSKKLQPNQAQPRSAVQLMINVQHRYPNEELTKEMVNETVSFQKESLKDLLAV